MSNGFAHDKYVFKSLWDGYTSPTATVSTRGETNTGPETQKTCSSIHTYSLYRNSHIKPSKQHLLYTLYVIRHTWEHSLKPFGLGLGLG